MERKGDRVPPGISGAEILMGEAGRSPNRNTFAQLVSGLGGGKERSDIYNWRSLETLDRVSSISRNWGLPGSSSKGFKCYEYNGIYSARISQ